MTFPVGKQVFDARDDLFAINIADNNHDRIIRNEYCPTEVDESFAVHGVERFRSWRHARVRVCAEHYLRGSLRRQKVRLRSLLNQQLLRILTREIDLVLRERRSQRDVSQQAENLVRIN